MWLNLYVLLFCLSSCPRIDVSQKKSSFSGIIHFLFGLPFPYTVLSLCLCFCSHTLLFCPQKSFAWNNAWWVLTLIVRWGLTAPAECERNICKRQGAALPRGVHPISHIHEPGFFGLAEILPLRQRRSEVLFRLGKKDGSYIQVC